MSGAWKLDSRTVSTHLLLVLVEAGHHPYDVLAGVADFLRELEGMGRAGAVDVDSAARAILASLPSSMKKRRS